MSKLLRLFLVPLLLWVVAWLLFPLSSGLTGIALAQEFAETEVSYLPLISLGDSKHLTINIINNDAAGTEVRVIAYSSDGKFLGEGSAITWLGAGEAVDIDPEVLPKGAASLQLESTGNIGATLIYNSDDGKKTEIFPASQGQTPQINFPSVNNEDISRKVIVLFNAHKTLSRFYAVALNKEGAEIGLSPQQELLPMELKTFSMEDFFKDECLKNTSVVRIITDNDIIGAQVISSHLGDVSILPAVTLNVGIESSATIDEESTEIIGSRLASAAVALSGANPLPVPFKAQVPPGSWASTNNCGQTSSLMAMSYIKGTIPTEQGIKDIDNWLLNKYGDPINNYNGTVTNITKLEALVKEFGGLSGSYKASGWGLTQLKQQIDSGLPVIAAVTAGYLSNRGYNFAGGHFVVVVGYTNTHIICNDPGTSSGLNKYYTNSEFANAFSSQSGSVVIVVPTSACISTISSTQWKGEYFNNKTLSGSPSMVRDDGSGSLNFDWGAGSPGSSCGIGVDNFSARWTRTVSFGSGTYRFTVTSDDGFRLYVDGVLKLDKWFGQATTTYTVDVPLTAGNHVIKMEYFEIGGVATAKLSWQVVSATGAVSGKLHVGSAGGTPLAGATVSCGGKTTTTDVNGFYILSGITPGNQIVSFSKTGYQPFSKAVNILANSCINAGDNWLVPNSCLSTVSSTQWKGEYFSNKTLSGSPSMVRDDGSAGLNFGWGTGGPSSSCGIGVDNFSTRWTRTVNFSSGNYRFTVTSDDGVRLYVDGVVRLDKWFGQASTTYTVDVPLTAGNHVIKMEYFEIGGDAIAKLSWQVASNSAPIAEAAVSKSISGPYYGYSTPLTVTKGQPVTLYFFADKDVNGDGKASLDPDGWTNSANGVTSTGKCEWNIDLNQGTPTFEIGGTTFSPLSAGACNKGPYTYTFNDVPGTYEYQMLRITDSKGAQSNVSRIKVTVLPADTALQSGAASNSSVSSGQWKYYYIDVPSGASKLEIKITNLSSDVDLYTLYNGKPTSASYTCRPYLGGTSGETCTYTNPAAGRWWAGVYGYSAGSYTITATVTTGSSITPILRVDGGTSSTKSQGGTFTLTGSSYTPNGTITRYVDGTSIGTITASSTGTINWTWPTNCSTATGTYTVYAKDNTTGKTSNTITEVVTSSSSCSVSTCPSGNGYYCGSSSLGQNANYLYNCSNGTYTLKTQCTNGCQVNPPGYNDACR